VINISLSDHKNVNGRTKQLEEEERLKSEKEKKILFNQFINVMGDNASKREQAHSA